MHTPPDDLRPTSAQMRVLAQEFMDIMCTYTPIDHGSELRAVDAFFAYRLLLGRMPDAQTELANLLELRGTYREFLTHLLGSPEFGRSRGYIPGGYMLMAEPEGFRFWFRTADREMGVAMGLGLYEPTSVALVKRLVQPGMRCLDIGAQTGFYTCLMASRAGAGGSVIAIEPMPQSFELLTRNVHENGYQERVELHPVGASDADGSLMVSEVSNMFVVAHVDGAQRVEIQSRRLASLLSGPLDIVKIDIEGHEPAALRGMQDLLREFHPVIVTEANEYWLRRGSGCSSADYVAFLAELGYDVYVEEDLSTPLKVRGLELGELESINLVAFPHGAIPAERLAA
jgi:FkbM family methyltransferase